MTTLPKGLFGLSMAMIASMAALVGGVPARAATPRVGAPAPALVLRTLDGQSLDLAQFRGEVVVANVWATWCGPCRAEMPMLNAFFLAHRSRNLLLVGLSADRSRDKGEVARVMSAFAYPAALLSEARVDRLDEPRVLPITYVIDAAGIVRAVFGGTGAPLTVQALDDAVRPLLQP
jgi:thiol-disulfide isomerase/thioredoxin